MRKCTIRRNQEIVCMRLIAEDIMIYILEMGAVVRVKKMSGMTITAT